MGARIGLVDAQIEAVASAARKLIEDAGGSVLTSVTVRVGPGVDVGEASKAWKEAVSGSGMAGARVAWRRALHLFRCLDCEGDYFGPALVPCPRCCGEGRVVAEAPDVAVTAWR